MYEFEQYLKWDTVCGLEEDCCGSVRKLNPIISVQSYVVNVHGFCCHRWGGWGRQMQKSNKERFNNQPLQAAGSGTSRGLCLWWGCTVDSIASDTATGMNVIANADSGLGTRTNCRQLKIFITISQKQQQWQWQRRRGCGDDDWTTSISYCWLWGSQA